MPWNGSGTFNRVYSWVADAAAGLDIIASRMDTDTDDITSNGFGNTLTRDGQGQPTANLSMAGFRHFDVQNGVSRSDYASFGQVQDGLPNWTIAAGTSDAITAIYTPALTVLSDGQLCFLRAAAANATTTPTFTPNGLTPQVITRFGGSALGIGDIAGALAEIILRYNAANTRWELLNPSNKALNNGILGTGAVVFTLASSAPSGWLMFNDSTMGSVSSGAGSADNNNLALFNILFASPFTDSTCPLLTSTGSATTRAAQGSASAAWAANCRMSLPKMLGRALAVAGSGSGLTTRVLGSTVGEETHLLTLTETPTGITSSGSASVSGAISPSAGGFFVTTSGSMSAGATGNITGGALFAFFANAQPIVSGVSASLSGTSSVTSNNTSGGAHNNMQPSSFMNAIVKQ